MMPTQSVLSKTNNAASDLWSIISNLSHPQDWIPFLDSRKVGLSAEKSNSNLFYPSSSARFCSAPIKFEILNCSIEEKSIEVVLSSGLLSIILKINLYDLHDNVILDVVARSDIEAIDLPEINEILLGVCTEISSNIKLIARLRYASSNSVCTTSLDENPRLLSVCYPEMTVQSIERASGLSDFEINRAMENFQPIIVSNHGDKVPNFALLNKFSWWSEQYGHQSVPFMEFRNLAYDPDMTRGRTTLSNLISIIEKNPNKLKFAVYEHPAFEVLGLYEYLKPESIIPSGCPLIHSNIWIGTAHLKSPMHQDRPGIDSTGQDPSKMHNVNFQIAGRKHVILAHPNQTPFLHSKPSSIERPSQEIEPDLFAPLNFSKFPKLKEARFYEAVLNPGDLIYIPRGWWHAFRALENSINYNSFFSTHRF